MVAPPVEANTADNRSSPNVLHRKFICAQHGPLDKLIEIGNAMMKLANHREMLSEQCYGKNGIALTDLQDNEEGKKAEIIPRFWKSE